MSSNAEIRASQTDQERFDAFWYGVISELYKAAIRNSGDGIPYCAAMANTFEEVYRRLNFDELTVGTTPDDLGRVREQEVVFGLVALAFGNYIAWRGGFKLNKDFFVTSDH